MTLPWMKTELLIQYNTITAGSIDLYLFICERDQKRTKFTQLKCHIWESCINPLHADVECKWQV